MELKLKLKDILPLIADYEMVELKEANPTLPVWQRYRIMEKPAKILRKEEYKEYQERLVYSINQNETGLSIYLR